MKRLLSILLLLPAFAWGQNTTTVIPGSLRVVRVAHNAAAGDSVAVLDVNNNLKKAVMPGGGGSATGVNGLNGTTNIGLGGTLSQNTTEITGGFNFNINNATAGGANILQLQSFGSSVTTFDVAGNMHANGVAMLSSPLNGLIDLSGSAVTVLRNTANASKVFAVVNSNTGSTGNIINLQNPSYTMWTLGYDGSLVHTPIAKAVTGTALGYSMAGALKPTANGDLLVGMDLHPTFGTSTVSGIGSIVGGSGYPNGTKLSNVSGGTGKQAIIQVVVSGGAVTSASIIDGGVNYTNGDVLGIVITDSSGNPIGSGGSVTVTGMTSYSGTTNYALRTFGRDVFDQDYSSQFTGNDKVNKIYVDNRAISGSFSATGSATTTFTVTIGATQPNNTYKVQVTPTSSVAAQLFYVTNKTTTTFQVVYPGSLTGGVSFDWSVLK